MSSVGSTPSSTGTSSTQSTASTAPSSVDNSPSGSPSPSAASTPGATPASSVASSPASTAPTTPSNSRPPSPVPKPQPQPELSETQPTLEFDIPDNDALYLLLAEVERYAEMKCRADDQVIVADVAKGFRKGKAPPRSVLPKRFHQCTEADQKQKVDETFGKTLAALIKLSEYNGMYDHDDIDGNSIDAKSRPGKLGLDPFWFQTLYSQSISNKIAKDWVRTEKPEEVASQTLTSSQTGGTHVTTTALKQVQPALNVLAELVNTVNPYSEEDRPIYTQFPDKWQNLIRDGYNMVDHSGITPWPVGDKKVYTEEREGRILKYRSAMRPEPARFDTLGADESLYVQSQRRYLRDTIRDFASSAGFESTNRDSTDTQTRRAQTTALPESGPSTSGLSNPSNKPSRVSFADQSQTADAGTASNGRPQRKEDRDKEMREVFDRFRRGQASQTGTSCAQEAGIGQAGLAQTGSLASYG